MTRVIKRLIKRMFRLPRIYLHLHVMRKTWVVLVDQARQFDRTPTWVFAEGASRKKAWHQVRIVERGIRRIKGLI